MFIDVHGLRDPILRNVQAGELQRFLRAGLAKSFGQQLGDEDLDDLTQQSLHKVLTHLDRFEGRSTLTTWAMSIATREALQQLRSRRLQHITLDQAVSAGAELMDPARAPRDLQNASLHSLLHTGIQQVLSEAQRTALLAELGGLQLAEIAERQGRSRGALYKSLHDARRKLRAWLTEQGITAQDLEV